MSYSLLRNLLFTLPPETAHELSLDWMSAFNRLGLISPFLPDVVSDPVEVMGVQFPNRVGLAAGLDKNADHIDALGRMGFGFVEVGTITPRPQPGNPKPRLFRLKENQAIINRMGFNNEGVEHLLQQVAASQYKNPIGINIGKNFDTAVEDANSDYIKCLNAVYSRATYITVNVSSPNTPGLRTLQFGESLNSLLDAIKEEQAKLAEKHGRYVPIAIKIAPDMTNEELVMVAQSLKARELDGVIAGNTTLAREAVQGYPHAHEAGGLSGAPLTTRSTEVISQLKAELGESLPIIGVGGVMCGQDAVDKINAGASLVQIYTGFIYKGPALIRDAALAIKSMR
ncbi:MULTISPECIES: quinone-dependent dihydroorotate dehydrogenase [unclassified Oleiphilus]|jgi:dihydroorotate dehydrogenase|uniref:quinone-dependent dihydroorotate dehydrogenase n=1 Tax=unclassified Oleiphilus TaxID=2631174 RepID=UPI0007C40CE0|nr:MULTISPECIES: quinone-dependent dihydroorotate dehydrogenase [unclassified Oleiphilus]KZY47306.1 dihydroorotate dehydrogenase [Oleiphilus sp. HI0050]KZZ36143.1 dihydroorotate dehydrogenase [Oleiphilus sp. HI0086]KZZ39377.1 dihydroorotate dehydrogenase [Oleiphilus sp. HI0117]KZZ53176.1 dihydroorotate dehydrogenase [Oleiphilus sp. HI0123]